MDLHLKWNLSFLTNSFNKIVSSALVNIPLSSNIFTICKRGGQKKKKKALEIKIIKIWAIGRKTGGVIDTRSSRDS